MKNAIIEICSSSFEIAKGAEQVGAERIEICHDLSVGGLTPSYDVIEACSGLDLFTRVLIRPRAGNFVYSEDEIDQMTLDIQKCNEIGVEGVVIGALDEEGNLDLDALCRFRDTALDLKLIFHRGIDHCIQNDKFEKILDIGFDGILSSGSVNSVVEGMHVLLNTQEKYGSRLEIIAGGGVNVSNVYELVKMNISSIHFSCQKLTTEHSLSIDPKTNRSKAIKHIFDLKKWELISSKIRSS